MSALPETPLVEPDLREPVRQTWNPEESQVWQPEEPPPAAASTESAAPVRRPVSARQRAIYRRRRIVAAVLVLVLTVLVILGVQAVADFVSRLATPAQATPAPVALADDPVRLAVPVGGSAVPLSPAGVDGRGVIDPPAGQAVWYTGNDRVTPGELGTAVIVGSATGADGEATPFAQVTSLSEGDRVLVAFGDGVTLELDVVSASLVDRGDLESSDLLWGNQSETRRVALVTSDEVTDGDDRGTFLAVAELG